MGRMSGRIGSTYRDCSRRLALLGSLAILVGAGSILFALLHLVLPLLPLSTPEDHAAGGPRGLLMGFLVFALIGALFVWVGVGSLRRRRWVQPTMLVFAWTWLIAGAIGLLMVYGMLDDLVILATAEMPELPPEVVTATEIIVLGLACIVGVILPAAFVLAYRNEDVRRTCEAHDPAPGWTDRCPLRVLGLSVGLGLAALLFLPTALVPVAPVFGSIWTGWKGAVAIVVFSGLAGWMAAETYRVRWRGWWGTTILLVVAGISVVLTFLRVPTVELYRTMGYPERHLARLGGSADWSRQLIVWGTIVISVLSVVYMLVIRKHFRDDSA